MATASVDAMLSLKRGSPQVDGVPVQSKALKGLDSLLSIAQMPAGVPVATVAIGNATNAGLLAVRILANEYPELRERLEDYMSTMKKKVLASKP